MSKRQNLSLIDDQVTQLHEVTAAMVTKSAWR